MDRQPSGLIPVATNIQQHPRRRTGGVTSIRVLAWVVVVAMVAAIAYGFANGNFADNASEIWALPWGKVSLIDLYTGLALFGGWIAVREMSWLRTGVWWFALVTLGNLAAGVYLLGALFSSDDTTELLTGNRRAR